MLQFEVALRFVGMYEVEPIIPVIYFISRIDLINDVFGGNVFLQKTLLSEELQRLPAYLV